MHIFLIAGALLFAGFYFPPTWLALAGYIFYVAKTNKSRRNNVVEKHLIKMAESGKSETTIPNLYFEAACAYAKDHGGKLYEDTQDAISATITLRGKFYSVTFLKDRQLGGTYVTLG